MKIYKFTPLAALTLFAGANAFACDPNGAGVTPINSLPYTISGNGTYCLKAATNNTYAFDGKQNSRAITINAIANGTVVLYLNNQTIKNTDAAHIIDGVYATNLPTSTLTIQNGSFNNFTFSARLTTSSGSTEAPALNLNKINIANDVSSFPNAVAGIYTRTNGNVKITNINVSFSGDNDQTLDDLRGLDVAGKWYSGSATFDKVKVDLTAIKSNTGSRIQSWGLLLSFLGSASITNTTILGTPNLGENNGERGIDALDSSNINISRTTGSNLSIGANYMGSSGTYQYNSMSNITYSCVSYDLDSAVTMKSNTCKLAN